ncbi:MAG: sigma-70 family RNA polymerase sigma factor [Synoicihabitans sp.]
MKTADPHESTFVSWLQEHGGILQQLSRVYAPQPSDAEELHREMMVQLWRSVPRFAGQAKASTWIYRVCLNTGLTWQRTSRRRESRVTPASDTVEATASGETSPADREERGDLMNSLMEAVRSLPKAQRSLVVLALDDLSYREIADVTGLTENHVGVALSRARKALTQKMKEISHEL